MFTSQSVSTCEMSSFFSPCLPFFPCLSPLPVFISLPVFLSFPVFPSPCFPPSLPVFLSLLVFLSSSFYIYFFSSLSLLFHLSHFFFLFSYIFFCQARYRSHFHPVHLPLSQEQNEKKDSRSLNPKFNQGLLLLLPVILSRYLMNMVVRSYECTKILQFKDQRMKDNHLTDLQTKNKEDVNVNGGRNIFKGWGTRFMFVYTRVIQWRTLRVI